jgi:hypothetical protein
MRKYYQEGIIMYKQYPTFYNFETFEYDRKSRFDDPYLTFEEVLEKHARIIDEYARKYLSGPIPPENKFQEVGSGETIDDRPEMLRLLKAIEDPKIKAIIVVDVQRLSRGDLEDAGRLIKILRYTNTYVITPYKIYDLRDEFDRDAFERELKRGNEYLEYFKKISLRGKLDSVREGNYIGSVPPYGFNRIVKENGKKICHTLEERKDQADIVRLIFQWYCNDDIGVTAICRRLEAMKVKTPGGTDLWRTQTVFTILENVHYIGCVRWDWRKTIKIIKDQEIKELRPKAKVGEYLIFNGKHEGIISEELFNKAKEVRGNRHRARTDTTLKNPLSGVLICKKCGAKMGYNTYRRKGVEYAKPRVMCHNQVHCKTGSAIFDEVLERVCDSLNNIIEDFEVRVENQQDDSIKLHIKLVAQLEKQLEDLKVEEKLQWKAKNHPNPDERMPSDIFKELNEELLKKRADITQALCDAKDSIPDPIDYGERAVTFRETLELLKDPTKDASVKNMHLKRIIEKIEYHRPANVKITNENKKELGYTKLGRKNIFHSEPFEISIFIK